MQSGSDDRCNAANPYAGASAGKPSLRYLSHQDKRKKTPDIHQLERWTNAVLGLRQRRRRCTNNKTTLIQ